MFAAGPPVNSFFEVQRYIRTSNREQGRMKEELSP